MAKIIATAQSLVVAGKFGTSDALDAYLIAFLIPSFMVNILAGSLNAAFIPAFIQEMEINGKSEAQKLLSNVLVCSLIMVSIVIGVLAIVVPCLLPILGSGFSVEKIELTRSLFYTLLPIILFSGLATILGSVLNAMEHFAVAAIIPVITPLCGIGFLIFTAHFIGIYALSIGTIIGFLIESGILIWSVKRHDYQLKPRWYGLGDSTKQVIKQYIPMIAGAFLMGSTEIVDKSMAAMLSPGSVSALNYGNKFIAFIIGIISIGLSTAIFPYFSKMTAHNKFAEIRQILKSYSIIILLVFIPFTVAIYLFSEPVVRILFERDAFKASDTVLVADIQAFYVLQVPFYILGVIGVRLLSALRKNHILMSISALNLVVNIAGNYVLIDFFGVAGISLSTSVVYLISTLFIYFSLYFYLKQVS